MIKGKYVNKTLVYSGFFELAVAYQCMGINLMEPYNERILTRSI